MKSKYKTNIEMELERIVTTQFPSLDDEPFYGELLELIEEHVDNIVFDVDELLKSLETKG